MGTFLSRKVCEPVLIGHEITHTNALVVVAPRRIKSPPVRYMIYSYVISERKTPTYTLDATGTNYLDDISRSITPRQD